MTRLERCEWYKNKGYIYDPKTGKIFGVRGKEIIQNQNGYIVLSIRGKNHLKAHHFAWYMIYDNVDFIELDHIDTNKSNNKIDNLRIVTKSQQNQNRSFKGISWHKMNKKWISRITVNGKTTHLGYFNTEEEARNAYLQAKEKYHII